MREEKEIFRVPVRIEKVLELRGAFEEHGSTYVYAHVSRSARTPEGPIQYALIGVFPRSGRTSLGAINSETRRFSPFDPTEEGITFYERARNHVVKQMYVPASQLEHLQKVGDVLTINGISVERTLIPED